MLHVAQGVLLLLLSYRWLLAVDDNMDAWINPVRVASQFFWQSPCISFRFKVLPVKIHSLNPTKAGLLQMIFLFKVRPLIFQGVTWFWYGFYHGKMKLPTIFLWRRCACRVFWWPSEAATKQLAVVLWCGPASLNNHATACSIPTHTRSLASRCRQIAHQSPTLRRPNQKLWRGRHLKGFGDALVSWCTIAENILPRKLAWTKYGPWFVYGLAYRFRSPIQRCA